MECANHPGIVTHLRCSKCEKPICFRCMIETPVGHRCRDCAQLSRLPVFVLTPTQGAMAVGAAFGMALLGGLAWAIVYNVGFGFLLILIGGGIGYGVGEGISRAVNRKEAPPLAYLAGAAAAAAFLLGNVWFWWLFTPLGLGEALGRIVDLPIRPILFPVLSALLSVGLAVGRFRRFR